MKVESIEIISNSLKEYRKARGLTQQDIADLAGVSRKAINELEQGKDTIQFKIVLKVLAVTDLELTLQGGAS
jgi:y4mF family transcriptional regulator